tara:strand:+ start:125 stop:697 length:573 start_codon:yes stop_codon:yes gene_type:complete
MLEGEKLVKNYLEDLISSQEKLETGLILDIAEVIYQTIKKDNQIFFVGNGGSSATPSHSAGDYSKELGARAICLTDNTPSVTAWANDTSYDNIFRGQLETFLNDGDIVIGYSGSGNSKNVLKGLEYAKDFGCKVIGITGNYAGKGAGEILKYCDFCLTFQTESMERIEDMQLVVNHIIKDLIKYWQNNGK